IAAAHGTTLTLDGSTGWNLNSSVALHFGATGQDGTVVWFSPSGSTGGANAVDVDAGTLQAGDANLGALLNGGSTLTSIRAGPAIELAGFSTTISDRAGNGSITDSGAAAPLTLGFGVSYAGSITGPLSLTIAGPVSLIRTNTYTGSTTINSGAAV